MPESANEKANLGGTKSALNVTQERVFFSINQYTVRQTPSANHNLVRKELIMAKSTTFKVGRSAVNGQFTTVQQAKKKPSTHIVETVKKSGK